VPQSRRACWTDDAILLNPERGLQPAHGPTRTVVHGRIENQQRERAGQHAAPRPVPVVTPADVLRPGERERLDLKMRVCGSADAPVGAAALACPASAASPVPGIGGVIGVAAFVAEDDLERLSNGSIACSCLLEIWGADWEPMSLDSVAWSIGSRKNRSVSASARRGSVPLCERITAVLLFSERVIKGGVYLGLYNDG
jgi:hypothetical protein